MAPPRLTPTHSGSLGMAGVLRFWSGFSFSQMGVSGDRGTMIAVFEISQQIPSDCLPLKFPSILYPQREQIQMLQIGRRFDRV
jgi:hypothetical protein